MSDLSTAQRTFYNDKGTLIDLDVTTVEQAKQEGALKMLVERVGLTLDKYYPGYAWHVSFEGGMIKVLNYSLSGDCGFRLTPDEIDVEGKTIMRYAGQLFEMYRVARGARPEVVEADSDYNAFSQLSKAVPKKIKQAHDLKSSIHAALMQPPGQLAAA